MNEKERLLVTDSGLGCFEEMFFVLICYAILACLTVSAYGAWRLIHK